MWTTVKNIVLRHREKERERKRHREREEQERAHLCIVTVLHLNIVAVVCNRIGEGTNGNSTNWGTYTYPWLCMNIYTLRCTCKHISYFCNTCTCLHKHLQKHCKSVCVHTSVTMLMRSRRHLRPKQFHTELLTVSIALFLYRLLGLSLQLCFVTSLGVFGSWTRLIHSHGVVELLGVALL